MIEDDDERQLMQLVIAAWAATAPLATAWRSGPRPSDEPRGDHLVRPRGVASRRSPTGTGLSRLGEHHLRRLGDGWRRGRDRAARRRRGRPSPASTPSRGASTHTDGRRHPTRSFRRCRTSSSRSNARRRDSPIGTIARTHHPALGCRRNDPSPRLLVPRAADGGGRAARGRACWSRCRSGGSGRLGRLVAPDRPGCPRRSSRCTRVAWVAVLDGERPLPAAGALVAPLARRVDVVAGDRRHGAASRSACCSSSSCRTSAGSSCSSCSRPRPLATHRVARRPPAWRSSGSGAQGGTCASCSSSGAGPRGQAFAAKLEDHRELGLRVDRASSTTEPSSSCRRRWPLLGSLDDLETRPPRRRSSTRSRSACRSRSGPRSTRSPQLCEEEGKIVRIPMDVLDRAISTGRDRGARRDAGLLARLGSGPRARAGDQAASRPRRRRPSGSSSCSPAPARASPSRSSLDDGAAGPVPPDARRPPRAAVRRRQVPVDGASTPRRAAPSSPTATRSAATRSRSTDDPRITQGRAVPAPDRASTSCPSCGTSCAAR